MQHQTSNTRNAEKRLTGLSPLARTASWMSTASLLICLTGCLHPRVVVIPADKEVRFLRQGQTLTAPTDLYLVPPARMQEILRALGEKAPLPGEVVR